MSKNEKKEMYAAEVDKTQLKHQGRMAQTGVYLGKLFRMFIFQSDWKVFPMAAVIAGLVCYVVGDALFKTMEGTLLGSFAVSCICIWNGFFNSIQVICRERAIIKREHRSGMHITSYVLAHMIYQACLCLGQTLVTLYIFKLMKIQFPAGSLISGSVTLDLAITIFLTTYAADMMSLMISSFVRSTTTAMTVMPFLLIFQLVFSGGFFSLSGTALKLTDFTVAKWGLTALCSQGHYNELPMVSIWNNLKKLNSVEIDGEQPLHDVFYMIEQTEGGREEIMLKCAEYNQKPEYDSSPETVLMCWSRLSFFIVIFACLSVASLEYVDRDKR